ncbi:hypothetical protein O9K63_12135 [Janibacter cremeus]|uniref:hypothetical protein n=1 Tax=Janibacter cremeus TaxID=1285192 RepID=UPI0023F6A50F|nr:hypothetical protein [Janibacter cremeus]WEV77335.1 hypothetical protein O9K63_12135 [Janibacter cremeus]
MRTRVVALAAATAAALSGCSMLDQASDSSDSNSQSTGSGDGAESSGPEGDPEENGAKAANIDTENPPEAIASVTLDRLNHDTVEETKVELVELRKDTNVMLATFRLTGEGRGTESTSAFDLLGNNSFRPVFVDMENMEKYRNVTDLTSSDIGVEAPLGQPVYMFTAFPLPREGVETMDLQIVSARAEIVDVPMPK